MSRRACVLFAVFGLVAASCGSGDDQVIDVVTDTAETETSTDSGDSASSADSADSGSSGGLSSRSESGSSGGSSNSSSDDNSSEDGDSDEGGADNNNSGSGGGQISSEVQTQLALTLDDAFPVEVEACLYGEIADDEQLLAALISGQDFEDLEDVEQARVASLAINCAEPGVLGDYMVDAFSEGSGIDAPDEMGDCLEGRMRGPDGEQVILGFIAVGDDRPAPESARQPLIDTMVECLPGSLFADAITSEIADDPSMADAIDEDCVAEGYEDPSITEDFWTAFVDSPDAEFEELPPEVQAQFMAPIINCLSFSSIIAAEAEADGVTLSQSTLDCIDDKIAESGLMEELFAGGEPDEAVLGAAILGCLSADELQQMAES